MSRRLVRAVASLSLGIAAAACGQGSTEPASGPVRVVVTGLEKPVDFVSDPTHPARFYILEQTGAIRIVEDGTLLDEPFFTVDPDNFTDRNWEQGLLGMALDPNWEESRIFYLNYSGKDGSTHLSRFTADSPHHASNDTEEIIFTIDQPYGNHNGGCIRFGPDGMLYIGMGDGGAANDPHGHGQDLRTPLGAMLRVDVTGEPIPGKNYAIPRDNPFRSRENADVRIWAYGLRNPWKFEFDSQGRMWIADVGQNAFEEVHVQRADSPGGENYGWNYMEGNEPFRLPRARPNQPERVIPSGLEPAVFTYAHHPRGSITGGSFYEGSEVDSLKERYICADFMSGRVWTFKLGDDGSAAEVEELTERYKEGWGAPIQLAISSFGQDNTGELYILDHAHGRLLRIVD